MKKILLFFLTVLLFANLGAQVIHTVAKGAGMTFDPADLTVNQNDIVRFTLTAPHDVTQVSLATWNADGTTPLTGGFLFSNGSGDYTAVTPGVIYYVCAQHVGFYGMKGKITVNMVTGINDIHKNSLVNLFPNPATDFITYQLKGSTSVQEVRILDLSGKAVKVLQKPEISVDQVKIDIRNLNKGIYFILVKSGNGIESGKFLKS